MKNVINLSSAELAQRVVKVKLVLLSWNPALISDAASNYKYVYGPPKVLYLTSETSHKKKKNGCLR